MKRLSVLLFALLVCMLGLCAAETCGDYLYIPISDSTAMLVGYTGTETEVVIPSEINGYSVRIIEEDSFSNSAVTSVTVPSSVIRINDFAFQGCVQLKSVYISEGCLYIGDSAFDSCGALRNVYLPGSLTSIGDDVFFGCDSVTLYVNAGSYAERYAVNAQMNSADYTAEAPAEEAAEAPAVEAVAEAAEEAAEGPAVEAAAEPAEEVAEAPAVEATEGPAITASNLREGDYTYSVKSDGTAVIDRYYGSEEGTLYIPSVLGGYKVSEIGKEAFLRSYFSTAVIPEGVTALGEKAFAFCVRLASVSIPESLVSVADGPFEGCSSLESISVSIFNRSLSVTDGVLISVSDRRLIAYPANRQQAEYRIPDGICIIGSYAFYGCAALESVTIPDSVTQIGRMPFGRCSMLKKLIVSFGNTYYTCVDGVLFNIPERKLVEYLGGNTNESYSVPLGISSIEAGAFHACDYLRHVDIPDSVTEIGYIAFSVCASLESVTIPDSVNKIGKEAFTGSDKLTVKVNSGSCAHDYCRQNGVSYTVEGDPYAWLTGGTTTGTSTDTSTSTDTGTSAISHTHNWQSASCTEPMVCSECGETKEPEHLWQSASGDQPQYCTRCCATTGEMLYHDWMDATYYSPRICTRCGATGGRKLTLPIGSTVTFGKYEQDNNSGNGKEDIEWRVLYSIGDRVLLISKYGLDCKPFNNNKTSVAWGNSSIRSWLNSTFINSAFTNDQQNDILTTDVDYSCLDKVFLLSRSEASRYFNDDTDRMCAPTQYAVAQGAWRNNYGYTVYGLATGFWWLRTQGSASTKAAGVRYNGGLELDDDVNRWDDIVRPAMWVNLDAIIP